MVKGISRQVIVVQSPDRQLFEQAIFILKEGQEKVSDDMLLKEAKKLINSQRPTKVNKSFIGPIWACGGALLTCVIWFITTLL